MQKLIALLIISFLGLWFPLQGKAQVSYHPDFPPSSAENQLDSEVKSCLGDHQQFKGAFSFSDWIALQHFYNRKLVQRLSSEHVEKIGAFKPQVEALAGLAQNCPALKSVLKDINTLQKLYSTQVTVEKSTQSTGLFEDEESKVSLKKGTAESLFNALEKIQKKLKISRRVIRVDD